MHGSFMVLMKCLDELLADGPEVLTKYVDDTESGGNAIAMSWQW